MTGKPASMLSGLQDASWTKPKGASGAVFEFEENSSLQASIMAGKVQL